MFNARKAAVGPLPVTHMTCQVENVLLLAPSTDYVAATHHCIYTSQNKPFNIRIYRVHHKQ